MAKPIRHLDILDALAAAGSLSVNDLAARLDVSSETVRRDLKALADSGDVVKTHGRAALSPRRGEAPFERRMRENADAKRAIALLVAETVTDGDSVMLDTGTTTSFVARALLARRGLTIVTNSSDIARTLAIVNDNTVFMAGGQLRADNGAAFGAAAVEFVRRFKVRHAIVSIGAVSAEAGAMNYDLAEAEFGREVLACGERRLIVTDATKFGRSALVKVCGLGDFDVLVTDAPPPPDLAAALSDHGATVLTPRSR
ncbi:MAG TPA: DeoR/GlpR family DNA-binding transcription regulator [Methylomirabilota bacterium]|nr:DeoR/GlpR family DNA-binding transcription regulator [Methylomirabilota bacterium]